MNREETAYLLGIVALGDNRHLSTELTKYWHSLLLDIRIEDAVQAVETHRRESTEWLQPAHIRRIAKADRHLRLVTSNVIHEPDADDSIEADRRKRLALVRKAADGQIEPQPIRLALAGPDRPAEVPELVAAKTEAFRAARTPLQTPCPFCKATPGNPCRVGKGTRPNFMHPGRREAHSKGMSA